MRRITVLLILATAGALVPASSAHAYRLFKHRWYSKTLTYHDATGGKYRDQIKAAAQVLNRSGARVKVRAASRRRARVQVRLRANLAPAGQARFRPRRGIVRRATVLLRTDLAKNYIPQGVHAGITMVVAHEFAHVLGLNHENRRCATMNSVQWEHCPRPPVPWQYRCRILETDDVRGLVRRFGGRVRGVGADFCDAEAAPAAPAGLTATPEATNGTVKVAWTDGAVPLTRARILRGANGACPTGPADPAAVVVAVVEASPGRVQAVDDYPGAPGNYCYGVVGLGALGRPGALATVPVAHPGNAPYARFTGSWNATRTALQLQDQSIDRDGTVVAWAWNFGDGTRSTARNPTKSWSRAGTYTVTLTVTDNTGLTNAYSTTVQIQAGSNQGTMLSH